ncbi:MAG TPA: dienelactone hydrolase family protein [Bryobacteraceae bacterium]|nr:dienelactone hydrolase family protein [Bryobacteraceae bacterium]
MNVRIPTLDGKSEFSAYLAIPRRPTAGVVVLQEIFGVNANIRSVCDFFASRQLIALAPDLFWRVEPNLELAESDIERALALRGKVDDDQASDDAAAAMAWLSKHPSCTGHVGVAGYCWGGLLAYLTAVRHKPEAAVSYYGVGIEQKLGLAKNLACPLLLHFAELDKYAPPAVIAQVREAYKGDPRVTIYQYPGCDHAFARKNGHNFQPYHADQADMRTLSFLVAKLIGHR